MPSEWPFPKHQVSYDALRASSLQVNKHYNGGYPDLMRHCSPPTRFLKIRQIISKMAASLHHLSLSSSLATHWPILPDPAFRESTTGSGRRCFPSAGLDWLLLTKMPRLHPPTPVPESLSWKEAFGLWCFSEPFLCFWPPYMYPNKVLLHSTDQALTLVSSDLTTQYSMTPENTGVS